MKTIDSPPAEKRGYPELLAFLHGCREEARKAGSFRIATISLRVGRIDPLAVLESIFEPSEHHFYLEKKDCEEAIAGSDAVVILQSDGPDRFIKARAFIDDILERTICIGDLDAPRVGPHFFCSFSFFDNPGADSPFPGVTVFLPRWQVSRLGSEYSATANLRIEADSDLEPLAEKVWRAHQRFSAFKYEKRKSSGGGGDFCTASVLPVEEEVRYAFEESVEKALGLIQEKRFQKVVLARYLDVEMPMELNPLHALNRLRMAYPNCFTYSVANGRGQSMIGASPERLARRKGEVLETEALAGSAPRGSTAVEDAALAEELLESAKDVWEHQLVIDAISRRLKNLSVECEPAAQPDLLQLANVQHLRTAFSGKFLGDSHLLDVIAALHPTPAVGGTPREPAYEAIAELETFPRGLYTGAIGWIDSRGDGDFAVAIRSTLVDGTRARAYAGAGIVEGSVPAREWNETEVKLRAVLEVLT